MPNGRCRMHGGATPKSAPTVKHGRRATYTRIFGQRYLELVSDPEILKCHEELALLDVLFAEQLELLRVGYSETWVTNIQLAVRDLHDAVQQARDPRKIIAATERLRLLADEGGSQLVARRELRSLIQSRSDIATRADTVAARREQTVTDRDIIVILRLMMETIIRVAGRDIANRVAIAFQHASGISNPTGPAALLPGDGPGADVTVS